MTRQTIGDPSRFALQFRLVDDPDAGGSALRRASWGELAIWVAGVNLTLARTPTQITTDAAVVPLLPVVEWLARSWNPLLHEERPPRPWPRGTVSAASWRMDVLRRTPSSDDDLLDLLAEREAFWGRHGLGSALADFRVPDLHIRRLGESVELSWDDREWRSVPLGVSLAERPGRAILPAEEVAEVLHRWALAVLDAVATTAPLDHAATTELEGLRGQLVDLRQPAHRPARLQWMAGVDLTAAAVRLRKLAGVVGGEVQDTVRALLDATAPQGGLVARATLPALLFRSASPRLSEDDLAILVRLAGASGGEATTAFTSLRARAPVPAHLEAVTMDGVERAHVVREVLGLADAQPLVDADDLETVLLPRLGVEVEDVHLDDTGVDGIAIAAPDRAPLIAINGSGRFARTPWGRRMTLAHELCHLLYDADDRGLVGVVSNPWADAATERRANAFAVTLLAPEAALAAVLPQAPARWTRQALRAAMERLGIGVTTLTWQLQNLGWISDSDRRSWVEELSAA